MVMIIMNPNISIFDPHDVLNAKCFCSLGFIIIQFYTQNLMFVCKIIKIHEVITFGKYYSDREYFTVNK